MERTCCPSHHMKETVQRIQLLPQRQGRTQPGAAEVAAGRLHEQPESAATKRQQTPPDAIQQQSAVDGWQQAGSFGDGASLPQERLLHATGTHWVGAHLLVAAGMLGRAGGGSPDMKSTHGHRLSLEGCRATPLTTEGSSVASRGSCFWILKMAAGLLGT